MKQSRNLSTSAWRLDWTGYLLAAGLTGVTILARVVFGGRLADPTMIVFTMPIILSAYWGGLGPGLLATVISALGAAFCVLPPLFSFNILSEAQLLQEAALLLAGGLISVICSLLQHARQRANDVIAELQFKESELAEALKTAGELKTAIDMHANVVTAEPDGRIIYVNNKECTTSKYSRQELIGQHTRILNSGHHPREFFDDLWKTIKIGGVWHGEIKNRANDGSLYWVDATIVPFLDGSGKPRQYMSIRTVITERKQAEMALSASESRYRALFEYAPEGLVIVDPDNRYVDANPSLCKMLGYSREEMIGMHASAIAAPSEVQHVEPALAMIKSTTNYHREWLLLRKDGSSFEAEVNATEIPDGNVLAMIRDITERKGIEAGLKKTHLELEAVKQSADEALEYAESIINTVREPLIALDRDLRVVTASRSFYEVFKVNPEETVGQLIYNLGNKQWDIPKLRELLEDILPKKATFDNYEVEHDFSAIGKRIMLLNARQIQRGLGKERIILLAIKDITARKEIEAGLEKSRKELEVIKQSAVEALEYAESVINTVREPLIALDQDLRVVTASRSFYEVFKVNPEETVGQLIYDLGNKQWDIPKLRELLENILPQKATFDDYEVEHDFSGVGMRIMLLNARQIQRVLGKERIILLAIEDITERKRVQGELTSSKKRAEDATAMKTIFLANMSHEIRTPMNAVIGLSHLALKTELSSKQHDYLTKIHNAGVRILSLINDILDISKIEAGKLEMEQANFEIEEVIDRVSAIVAEKADSKGLAFRLQIASDIPRNLVGDQMRLGQILINLVNNAVKFTAAGEVELGVELLEQTGDRAKLRFAVRDTGIGMSREQISKLFQPFAQADGSTTRKFGGTGLGLSICKRLVEIMGGQIWVESREGQGSGFIFTAWFGTVGKALTHAVPNRLSGLRMLIVDDNQADWSSLIRNLEAAQFAVDIALSGLEAIALIKQHDSADPYGIVFMDWRMAEMGGNETTRAIKSDRTLKRIPFVVVVTAIGREEIRIQAIDAGADGFLVKPVGASTLIESIVELYASEATLVPKTTAFAKTAFELQGIRILLVEDNDINQQIAEELLVAAGAIVDLAANGRAGVDKVICRVADSPPYDLVLMDIQMPEMDGYEATRLIRADGRFGELPIIAMTAHAMQEERQRCHDAGMIDHITKPIDPQAMFETISHWCKQPSVAPTITAPLSGIAKPEALDLPEIPQVNVADGLARVAGNRKLYLNLLRKFVESQGGAAAAMKKALARGEREIAERIAHTAKGVSGNIGAGGVQALAGELEQSIRNNDAPERTDEILLRFSGAMEKVVSGIRAALGNEAETSSASAVEPAERSEIARLMSKLANYLQDHDSESVYYFESIQGRLHSAFSNDELSELDRNISRYDFKEARRVLGGVAARLQIELERRE